MKKLMLTLALAAAMVYGHSAPSDAGEKLPAGKYVTKSGLKKLFPGTFAAKFKKYRVRFVVSRNGTITGRYKMFSDKGTWRVRNRQLCITLKSWFKGKTQCSHVIKYGPVYVAKDVVFRKL
ncbi:MAG: hypothetical protein AAF441_24660 [Pseudomonadota bacterium]